MVKLVWHCAWCTGGESNLPPLPPGQAYTGGICKLHLKKLKGEISERRTNTTSTREFALLRKGVSQEAKRLLERPEKATPHPN